MATIDIKLKSYDELIFEITKLNTDKYLLEQENKQLKERIDKAIEYINNCIKPFDTKILNSNEIDELIKILGEKEND